jgi:hypothetical protein
MLGELLKLPNMFLSVLQRVILRGIQFIEQLKTPLRFMPITFNHASSLISPTLFASPPIPALLKATSRLENVRTVFSTAASTALKFDTSQSIKIAFGFFALISDIAASVIGDFMSTIAMFAPCSAAASAHALPIPDCPPVIKTVLFSNFFIVQFFILSIAKSHGNIAVYI